MEKICKYCAYNSGRTSDIGNIKCISPGMVSKTEPTTDKETGETYYALTTLMRAVPCIHFSREGRENLAPDPIEKPKIEEKPEAIKEPKENKKEEIPEKEPEPEPEKIEEIKEDKKPPAPQISMDF